MAIDRKVFFDGVRSDPFHGTLNNSQVQGMSAILDSWETSGLGDLRWLAYMFATVLAECGSNMLPVREGFKKTDADARAYVQARGYPYAQVINGQVYYGRGLVQLTWEKNYAKMGGLLGIDLVNDPDLALDPPTAASIMFKGMTLGTFTGKKLADYFNDNQTDWRNARRIINALDRADEIAGYGQRFFTCLTAATAGA
jgi:putative chitinase